MTFKIMFCEILTNGDVGVIVRHIFARHIRDPTFPTMHVFLDILVFLPWFLAIYRH